MGFLGIWHLQHSGPIVACFLVKNVPDLRPFLLQGQKFTCHIKRKKTRRCFLTSRHPSHTWLHLSWKKHYLTFWPVLYWQSLSFVLGLWLFLDFQSVCDTGIWCLSSLFRFRIVWLPFGNRVWLITMVMASSFFFFSVSLEAMEQNIWQEEGGDFASCSWNRITSVVSEYWTWLQVHMVLPCNFQDVNILGHAMWRKYWCYLQMFATFNYAAEPTAPLYTTAQYDMCEAYALSSLLQFLSPHLGVMLNFSWLEKLIKIWR